MSGQKKRFFNGVKFNHLTDESRKDMIQDHAKKLYAAKGIHYRIVKRYTKYNDETFYSLYYEV